MPEEVEGSSATVVELRVATLKSPNEEDRKVHWELMEDGELVNMGEWQMPRDQGQPGPQAWENLILHLALREAEMETVDSA